MARSGHSRLWCVVPVALGVLLAAVPADAALRITEFLASNESVLGDEDGAYSDWIEVHNDAAVSVSLLDWALTDNAATPTKWRFPAVEIPPGGYLVVFASDKNRRDPTAELHTNFKLSAAGEYLALIRPDGVTVEHAYAPAYPVQRSDVSFGLAADLAAERCYLVPTPAAANDDSAPCILVDPPTFDVPHGFHESPFGVQLASATAGAMIHFTTDGSEPTPSHGTLYVEPVAVGGTTILRAVAFKDGATTSPSVTQTYVFVADVLRQSQATISPIFPAMWGSEVTADYEMDPEVVGDPLYAATIAQDLLSLPALSIVTDIDHLFGAESGIYTHPHGHGMEWERPASVELIFPDGSGPGFQKNGGIRVQGQTARTPSNKKQSLSLRFRGEYAGHLSYPLFAGSPVDNFTQLRLTAGHQNSWHSNLGGQPARAQFARDIYAHDLQLALGQPSSHARFVHLYLNGLYWGLYGLKERPDDDFMASYYGGSDGDYDVLKDNELEHGDRNALETLRGLLREDLSDPARYAAVREFLDVDNLIDYMLLNFYLGNEDWGYHNWIVARKREAGAGFLFFAWDSQLILGGVREVATDATEGPLDLFGPLARRSPDFRLEFADHVRRHLFGKGVLTPRAAAARWERRAEEVERAVVGESARWGDKLRPDRPYTRDNEWFVEHQRLRLDWFPQRTAIVLEQLRARGLYPALDAPELSLSGGEFFPGAVLQLSAPRGTIVYTLDGSDPRLPGGAVSPAALTYAGALELETSVRIAARVREGANWSALSEAAFVPATPLRIVELMYNAPGGSTFEFIELANIGPAAIDLTGVTLESGVTFAFPVISLGAGARVVVVENRASFESRYGAGPTVAGVYSGSLSNGGEELRLRDASGGVIQEFVYDDAWVPSTDGPGQALVVRAPEGERAAWNEAAGWRAGPVLYGSPGAGELPVCADTADNDGDGAIDLADAGCAGPSADDEQPQCNDGLDNDGDLAIDLSDTDCGGAADPVEASGPEPAFLCYRTRPERGGPRFTPTTLHVEDALSAPASLLVRRDAALCAAGELDWGGPPDPASGWLEVLEIREARGVARPERHVGLRLTTPFGPLVVDTLGRSDRLLVPANVSSATPPEPAPGSGADEAYRCHQAVLSPGAPATFPLAAQAHIAGALDVADVDLTRPVHLCAPAALAGGAPAPGRPWLLCHPARIDGFSPRHERWSGLHVASALAATRVGTVREENLCVPARPVAGVP